MSNTLPKLSQQMSAGPNTGRDIGRRSLLTGVLAGSAAVGVAACSPSPSPKVTFPNGVASGDPLADAVIVWTRAVPEKSAEPAPVTVSWVVASDSAFTKIVRKGAFTTDAARDYTVKADVRGLEPAMSYFYRFEAGGQQSPIGRTKTLHQGPQQKLRLALMSCSNYAFGYFNAYKHCAERPDIDVVLHVGDYIYEYGPGKYGDPAMEAADRALHPASEIVSLADYRERYALYRSDPDLQAIHAAFPFITVWDDHELANDCWMDGAENHHPDEGTWSARKAAAIQAYGEWMPIRALECDRSGRIYRSFAFGDLATLVMLDTRVYGRDRQLSYTQDVPLISLTVDATNPDQPHPIADGGTGRLIPQPYDLTATPPRKASDVRLLKAVLKDGAAAQLPEGFGFLPDWDRFKGEVLNAPERSILGQEQEAWLETELRRSHAQGIPWRVLGQQTLLGLFSPVDPTPYLKADQATAEHKRIAAQVSGLAAQGLPLGLDSFGDGYRVARERLLGTAVSHGGNVIVLSGDSHNAWAFNLKDKAGTVAAVEIGVSSVTSPGFEGALPMDTAGLAKAMIAANPEMQWCDLAARGYAVVEITREAVTAEWVAIDTIKQRNFSSRIIQTLRVNATSAPGTATFSPI